MRDRETKSERAYVCEGSRVHNPLGSRIQSAPKQCDIQHSEM